MKYKTVFKVILVLIPVAMGTPSLCQVIDGRGRPWTSQGRTVPWCNTTCTSSAIGLISGGSGEKKSLCYTCLNMRANRSYLPDWNPTLDSERDVFVSHSSWVAGWTCVPAGMAWNSSSYLQHSCVEMSSKIHTLTSYLMNIPPVDCDV